MPAGIGQSFSVPSVCGALPSLMSVQPKAPLLRDVHGISVNRKGLTQAVVCNRICDGRFISKDSRHHKDHRRRLTSIVGAANRVRCDHFPALKNHQPSGDQERSVNTISSVGSPNINGPSTGASVCQLCTDLASLMHDRGFITSCKSVLSSNESESITVSPVPGRCDEAHVPILDAKR